MNTLLIVILSVLTIYLAYNLYAKRIDRNVIQPDAKRATPARMYMYGVDFMPTSRNVLFGYHFKAIAAANLWGWAPSLAWLILGVSFIDWIAETWSGSTSQQTRRQNGWHASYLRHSLG